MDEKKNRINVKTTRFFEPLPNMPYKKLLQTLLNLNNSFEKKFIKHTNHRKKN